jgi:hypothetical protein
MKKMQNCSQLILVRVMLFVTIAVAAYKMEGAATNMENWLIAKKESAISCGPNHSNEITKLPDATANTNRENKGNNNSCAHSQVTNALCNNAESKRRFIRNHTC